MFAVVAYEKINGNTHYTPEKESTHADDDECLSVNSSILEDVVHASQLIGCLQQQFC